jgi:peptidoglycan hydrolase-like protein with peptidoglycan-binding domain
MNKHMTWGIAATTFGLLLAPVTMEASQSDNTNASSPMADHHEERSSSGMMAEGTQGPMVNMLQQMLQDRGISTDVDGIFGPQTNQSVQTFQEEAGIAVDGIVGPQTMMALQDSMSENMGILRTGDANMHVRHMQQLLTNQDIETNTDGIFGPETRENVMNYQQEHELQVDGLVGPETMGHMMDGMNPEDRQQMMGMMGMMNNDQHQQMKGSMGEHKERHMNPSSSGEVPDDLSKAESPAFEVGDTATIEADHMEGMEGATATIAGAYDTTAYAVTFQPTHGGELVENHKWVIHEELNNTGEASLQPGDTAVLDVSHMDGMDGATATIDTAEETTVYMVDFTTTTDGEEITNHKWLTESELSSN